MNDQPKYDGGPDDAYVAGEEEIDVDWHAVIDLQEEFDRVAAIEDEDERMAAAKALVARMAEDG